jgi:hypothetical protein
MLSRRQVLRAGALLAAGAAAGSAAVAASAAKLKPADVAYQTMPNGDQRCSNCKYFSAPYLCSILTAPVQASGWCNAWLTR